MTTKRTIGTLYSLEHLSAVGTWFIVATSACYLMVSSGKYHTSNIVLTAILYSVFISLWLCSSYESNKQSKGKKWLLLSIQYLCVMGLYFLIPYNYSAILITIWCTLLPGLINIRIAILSAPLWSSPLWFIYQFHWHEDYAFVSAALFFMFNIFALIMINTATKERQAKEHANQLNRELLATQKLLNQASAQAERVRIARNIHDLLGHHLTALTINLQIAYRTTEGEAKERIQSCHDLAKLLLSDVREAVSEIREKSDLDLKDSLQALCNNVPKLKVNLGFNSQLHINELRTADTIIKCVQECLTNVLKHSTASLLELNINQDEQGINITAKDNGNPIKHFKIGNGLKGMNERLALINGKVGFTIDDSGFGVSIYIPQEKI